MSDRVSAAPPSGHSDRGSKGTTTLCAEAVPASGFWDLGVFALGAAVQVVAVYLVVPAAVAQGLEPIVAWMLISIPVVFLPILLAGAAILRSEPDLAPTVGGWIARGRWCRPRARDLGWGLVAVSGTVVATIGAFALAQWLGLEIHPPFSRHVEALTSDRLWIVGLWLVYWPINILGEEAVWRGVLLPRMEIRWGRWAWLINAAGWLAFHLAFGPGNNLVLIPTLLFTPWVAHKTRNTWTAVMVHTALSLPGFVALALGAAG